MLNMWFQFSVSRRFLRIRNLPLKDSSQAESLIQVLAHFQYRSVVYYCIWKVVGLPTWGNRAFQQRLNEAVFEEIHSCRRVKAHTGLHAIEKATELEGLVGLSVYSFDLRLIPFIFWTGILSSSSQLVHDSSTSFRIATSSNSSLAGSFIESSLTSKAMVWCLTKLSRGLDWG